MYRIVCVSFVLDHFRCYQSLVPSVSTLNRGKNCDLMSFLGLRLPNCECSNSSSNMHYPYTEQRRSLEWLMTITLTILIIIWKLFSCCFIVADDYHNHCMTNHIYKGKKKNRIQYFNMNSVLLWFYFLFFFFLFEILKKSPQAICRMCLTIMERMNLHLNAIQEINVSFFSLL